MFDSATFSGLNPSQTFMKRSNVLSGFIDDVSVQSYPEKAEAMKRSLMLAAVQCANAQVLGSEATSSPELEEDVYTPLMWAYDLVDRCGRWVAEDKAWEKREAEADARAAEKRAEKKTAEAKSAAGAGKGGKK